jgi:hypothetical protein
MKFRKIFVISVFILLLFILFCFLWYSYEKPIETNETDFVTLRSYIIDEKLNGAMPLHVYDDYAYVGLAEGKGLTIVDVHDKINPRIVGHIQDSINLDLITEVRKLNNYVYVSAFNTDRLTILDVSDITAPKIISSVKSPLLDGAHSIDVQGNYAYLTSAWSNAFSIWNISDPYNPTLVSYINDDMRIRGLAMVQIRENYAYVAVIGSDRFTIIDVSDKKNPFIVGSVYNPVHLDMADTFCLQDDLAFVTGTQQHNYLNAINLSNLYNPKIISSVETGNFHLTPNCMGNYIFLQTSVQSIGVINIEDIKNMKVIANFTSPAFGDGLYYLDVVGKYGYWASRLSSKGRFGIVEFRGDEK